VAPVLVRSDRLLAADLDARLLTEAAATTAFGTASGVAAALNVGLRGEDLAWLDVPDLQRGAEQPPPIQGDPPES
jgi:hypothetical protein